MHPLEQGLALHRQNRLGEAEGIYRGVLAQDEGDVDALHLLGLLLYQTQRHGESEEVVGRAIAIDGDVPQFWNVLGLALTGQGKVDEAIAAFERALELDESCFDAIQNLSGILAGNGRGEEAVALLRGAAARRAGDADSRHLLARLLYGMGRYDEALAVVREVLGIDPRQVDPMLLMGAALLALREFKQAGEVLVRAEQLRPHDAQVQYQLGLVYDRLGDAESAAARYERAIALDPNFVEAHNNLGVVRHFQRRLGEAIEHHQRAIAIRPGHASAWCNLGFDYWAIGLVEKAIQHYRKALELEPGDHLTHSNLLMAMHYLPGYGAEEIYAEHVRWGERHAEKFYPPTAPGRRDVGNSRLRIGYVSSNFREHAVSIFFAPMIAHHDHGAFEIFCYSDLAQPDAVTERIRQHADHWVQSVGLTDEQLDARIRADGIDILVDLNGHIANNRLLAFARKPAPVQVTYLGYPDTTGVRTIDYRLTDAWQDPLGKTDAFHTEKLVRLPGSAWTYDPWIDVAVTDVPSRSGGRLTFGSLNNLAKITTEAIEVWARILHRAGGSQMALLVQNDRFAEQYLVEQFAAQGIGRERLIFHTQRAHAEYLRLFSTLDVALDTFPYNGHTTTLNAIWMGVPVVTLEGKTHVARAGLGVLSTVGATELVSKSVEDYVELAVALAQDADRLVDYRRTLRERMRNSALLDGKTFMRNLEAAYREMWNASQGG